MRRVLLLALALAVSAIPIAQAGGNVKRLGTDPSGDAPPAIDIAYLDVGTTQIDVAGKRTPALEIRLGLNGMLPAFGSYPEVPAMEWIFKAGKRSFIAEAVAGRNPRFFLFELKGDTYEQLPSPTGRFDTAGGFAQILVPLEAIGAKRGTVLTGIKKPLELLGNSGADVDVHIHHATGTEYVDEMTTTKSFTIS